MYERNKKIMFTIDDMSINTIVRRRDLASRIPTPVSMFSPTLQRLRRTRQCSFGFLVPMDVLGLRGPKLLGVFHRPLEDFILEMCLRHDLIDVCY